LTEKSKNEFISTPMDEKSSMLIMKLLQFILVSFTEQLMY